MSPSSPVPVLTIDGPSGAGKGTISALAACRLGWHLLDSGALYRAVGYAASVARLDFSDEDVIVDCARAVRIAFQPGESGGPTRVIVNGHDASDELRTETCGAAASAVAGYTGVRRALLDKQREMRRSPGLVADGRDMGTVIFPDAPFKVFLTASAEERARRRYKQLKEKGLDVTLATLLEEIQARDARDTSRAVAPLKPADDAVMVDTTCMSIDEAVETVLGLVPSDSSGSQA